VTTRAALRHLKRQLSRLEGDSCGPGCPPLAWREFVQDEPGAELVPCDWHAQPLTEEPEPPAPCPRCGRPAQIALTIFDKSFFGNDAHARAANPLISNEVS
jgi:hypothetical protein